jgi:predicted RNase H-like nuclease (RuvC/YqgF family)
METNLWSVLITLVTVLGSTAAFRFYEKRAMHKERDEDFIRHDCKDRISKLEGQLQQSYVDNNELRKQILELTAMVAKLQTQVEFLQKSTKEFNGGL